MDGAPDWKAMVTDLNAANNTVMASLNVAIVECEKAGKVGISNFLQDRLDVHAKFGWQLRSIQ
jgi:DNA-binding ferritin-like protein